MSRKVTLKMIKRFDKYKFRNVILGVACLLLMTACGKPGVKGPEKHMIPVPENYPTAMDDMGADAFANALDNPQNTYYTINDYYNQKSKGSLHILPKFETYQQTTEFTCGASSALMVLNYFGETGYDEMQLAQLLQADENTGVDPQNMKDFFEDLGWVVTSNISTTDYFEGPEEFADYLIDTIDAGTPVLVDWVDWRGHWQVIIGIDTCSDKSVYDDVLILADPYDVTDGYQDGYYIYPLGRFFGMWYEGPCAAKDEVFSQPFVAAGPR